MKNNMCFLCQIFTTLTISSILHRKILPLMSIQCFFACSCKHCNMQYAIHFLAGKEMDVLHKVPVKSTVLRRSPWHVNSYRKARMVCNMATWGLHQTEAYRIWLSNSLALCSAVSKIHFRRCLPLSHSEEQKQKVYIGLSYLSPLYF